MRPGEIVSLFLQGILILISWGTITRIPQSWAADTCTSVVVVPSLLFLPSPRWIIDGKEGPTKANWARLSSQIGQHFRKTETGGAERWQHPVLGWDSSPSSSGHSFPGQLPELQVRVQKNAAFVSRVSLEDQTVNIYSPGAVYILPVVSKVCDTLWGGPRFLQAVRGNWKL